jgi:hypothetical protein
LLNFPHRLTAHLKHDRHSMAGAVAMPATGRRWKQQALQWPG